MVAYEVVFFRGCGDTHMLEKRQVQCKTVFTLKSFEVLRVPCPLFFEFPEGLFLKEPMCFSSQYTGWLSKQCMVLLNPFTTAIKDHLQIVKVDVFDADGGRLNEDCPRRFRSKDFSFVLRAGSANANVIGASYEFRVFFFPLTSWQGGATCS